MPSFFIGKTFQEAMKLSYFSTIDLSDSFSFDYNDSLIKKTVPNHSGILLIGIEYKDEIEPTISKFLINPLNYKIRRDDIGYVVAYDQANAKIITNFSEKSPIYSVYLKNMNLFKKLKVVEANNKFIDKMRVEMNERRSEWRIKKEKYFKRNNFKEIPDFNSKFYDIPDIYNLYTDNTPKGIFKNHIIIRGDLFRLKRIASVLRSYSERPILLFSDVQPNPSDWHKIRDTFSNVFYVYGLPTSINHIIQLDPKKAFKILVLSSSYNNFIMDSESIIFTRVLADFFELKNFLTELLDENNLKFISINPKYDNVGSFFWPFFARGSIHFSSLAMSIIAKSINNKSWLSFIRNLTKPNKFAEENSINEKYEQNSRINTLIITAETKKEFQFFGQLQYVLMNHDPQLIGIAVLKVKLTTAEPKKNTFMRQITMNNNDKSKSPDLPKKTEQVFSNHIMKIMEKFYGSEFLMTNPSFLMPLDVGDKVLVIGNTKYEDNNEYYGKISNTSMLLASPKQAKEKIKTQESLSFTIKNEKNHNNNKHEIFKEKLEDNLSSINDFMKFVMGNWDDLNENKMKVTHIKLND